MLKSALTAVAAVALVVRVAALPQTGAGGSFNVTDVLAKMQAAYIALSSYSDTGTVTSDVGGFADKWQFRTAYTKDPRNLFIEVKGVESLYKSGFRIPSNTRVVIWMQKGELEKWDQNGNHETFPANGGGQVEALKTASYGSQGITILIPSLVYTKANLATPIQAMEEPTAAGYETVANRRCYKVMGIERWRYPNGRVTGVRPISIWIDAENFMIRKIVEDTEKGGAVGRIDVRTITLEPQVNPKLEPSVFAFNIPPTK